MQSRRVLILGIGPIPLENPEFQHGTCWRSWQLAKALLDDGHEVFLLCFRVTGSRGDKDPSARFETQRERLRYLSLTEEEFVHLPTIRGYIDEFRPDCVVGANTYPSSILGLIDPVVPFWADINGYYMGEAQAKAARYDNDQYVKHYWDIMLPVLLRADRLSTASLPQKNVLIGELDMAGRLNRKTFEYDFIQPIPNGRELVDLPSGEPRLRGTTVPEDAFLVLWLGGYNLWYDMDVLFEGLERAMSRNPRIHYVSTGGEIRGQDDYTFGQFFGKIESSPNRERYHFLGWIPFEELDASCCECDVGLNVDADCYEVIFGARNRITDMMKWGLPVATTVGTEISRVVADKNCGFGFPMSDAEAMADALAYAAEHPEETRRRGENARRYFEQHYTVAEACRPLREWVAGGPTKAPDWHLPNAAGWPLPLRRADLRSMSFLRRMAYRYAKHGVRGLLTLMRSPEDERRDTEIP